MFTSAKQRINISNHFSRRQTLNSYWIELDCNCEEKHYKVYLEFLRWQNYNLQHDKLFSNNNFHFHEVFLIEIEFHRLLIIIEHVDLNDQNELMNIQSNSNSIHSIKQSLFFSSNKPHHPRKNHLFFVVDVWLRWRLNHLTHFRVISNEQIRFLNNLMDDQRIKYPSRFSFRISKSDWRKSINAISRILCTISPMILTNEEKEIRKH